MYKPFSTRVSNGLVSRGASFRWKTTNFPIEIGYTNVPKQERLTLLTRVDNEYFIGTDLRKFKRKGMCFIHGGCQ